MEFGGGGARRRVLSPRRRPGPNLPSAPATSSRVILVLRHGRRLTQGSKGRCGIASSAEGNGLRPGERALPTGKAPHQARLFRGHRPRHRTPSFQSARALFPALRVHRGVILALLVNGHPPPNVRRRRCVTAESNFKDLPSARLLLSRTLPSTASCSNPAGAWVFNHSQTRRSKSAASARCNTRWNVESAMATDFANHFVENTP